VLPIGRIDSAIELAERPRVILCTYGDTMRVPASRKHEPAAREGRGRGHPHGLFQRRRAEDRAREPGREVVFFAIGFETTTPPTAVALRQARAEGLKNFSVFCEPRADAVGDPEHPRVPRGARAGHGAARRLHRPVARVHDHRQPPYEFFAEEFQKPVVIAGFEPLDVLQSVLMLVRQLNEGRAEVENQFSRAVTREGNLKAQALVAEVFELRDRFEWRGLGEVPYSALRIRDAYRRLRRRGALRSAYRSVPDHKACECGAILRGVKQPQDCKVFGTVCTPDNPLGSCMVSAEGACAAYYTYGQFKGFRRRRRGLVSAIPKASSAATSARWT
jgi:hydrogenase expression/formation protein HypD